MGFRSKIAIFIFGTVAALNAQAGGVGLPEEFQRNVCAAIAASEDRAPDGTFAVTENYRGIEAEFRPWSKADWRRVLSQNKPLYGVVDLQGRFLVTDTPIPTDGGVIATRDASRTDGTAYRFIKDIVTIEKRTLPGEKKPKLVFHETPVLVMTKEETAALHQELKRAVDPGTEVVSDEPLVGDPERKSLEEVRACSNALSKSVSGWQWIGMNLATTVGSTMYADYKNGRYTPVHHKTADGKDVTEANQEGIRMTVADVGSGMVNSTVNSSISLRFAKGSCQAAGLPVSVGMAYLGQPIKYGADKLVMQKYDQGVDGKKKSDSQLRAESRAMFTLPNQAVHFGIDCLMMNELPAFLANFCGKVPTALLVITPLGIRILDSVGTKMISTTFESWWMKYRNEHSSDRAPASPH